MPFESVAALKSSDLYKRMPSLQQMGTGKLARFVAIFNSVFARATRGGASPDEAESRAIPIALVAARKAMLTPMSATRKMDATTAVFSLFASEMEHGESDAEGASVDMRFPDVEDINDIMAGQPFYGPHTHDRDFAEPQGIIQRIASRDSLPPELQAKVDPDIKIVAMAQFFADIPTEDRHATISPEWFTFRTAQGELHIPHTFITTGNPANDKVMGIGRVASGTRELVTKTMNEMKDVASRGMIRAGPIRAQEASTTTEGPIASQGNPNNAATTLSGTRLPMPDTPADDGLVARIASLEDSLKQSSEKLAGYDALKKDHDALKARLAGLAGVEEPSKDADPVMLVKQAESRIASLEKTLQSNTKVLEEMKAAAREADADNFRKELFETREVTAEAADKWRARFLADEEGTKELAATLPGRILPPGQSRAVANVEILDEKAAAQQFEHMKGAF